MDVDGCGRVGTDGLCVCVNAIKSPYTITVLVDECVKLVRAQPQGGAFVY